MKTILIYATIIIYIILYPVQQSSPILMGVV